MTREVAPLPEEAESHMNRLAQFAGSCLNCVTDALIIRRDVMADVLYPPKDTPLKPWQR